MNSKQFLVLSIVVLFSFVITAVIIDALGPCEGPDDCSSRSYDTDSGDDGENPGVCTIVEEICENTGDIFECVESPFSIENTDYCIDSNRLREYYPSSGSCVSDDYDCNSAFDSPDYWCGSSDNMPGAYDDPHTIYRKLAECVGSPGFCQMLDHLQATTWSVYNDCDDECISGRYEATCDDGGISCTRGTDCYPYTCSGGSCTSTCSTLADCDSDNDCGSRCLGNPGRVQPRGCSNDCECFDEGAAYCVYNVCGANCASNANCGSDGNYCSAIGEILENRNYYCQTTSSCTCTHTVVSSENCMTKDSYDNDDGGDNPSIVGVCHDYTECLISTCYSGASYRDRCTTTTSLTEYYADDESCSSKPYNCGNFENLATGNIGNDNTVTTPGVCTHGNGAGCANDIFTTSAGTGGGLSEGCISQSACPGGANCVYREVYAFDSNDACPGRESCGSTNYDPDTILNTCRACIGSGKWNLGGDEPYGNCCGDDGGEYIRTRECSGSACSSDPNDDACCNQDSDCVWLSLCRNNGVNHPSIAGVKCENGQWAYGAPPTTTINPNEANIVGNNVTSFTLTCADPEGPGCDTTYYKIIDSTDNCGTTGFTTGPGTSPVVGEVTCPFGQSCDKRVCYYSDNTAGLTEATKISNVFHLETNACQGRVCGQACLYTNGICDANNGNCYTEGGCIMDCNVPAPESGNVRIWDNSVCGRTGSYNCGYQRICSPDSISSCTAGGTSTAITGDWTSYTYPSDSYAVDDAIQLDLGGISASPLTFSILAECEIVKANGNGAIYFDNWGSGSASFQYTIQATDPEGVWNVSYCQLWSDFVVNGGWQLKDDSTVHQFIVDVTPPSIYINDPAQNDIYNNDFTVNVTVLDTWSDISVVRYQWENDTDTGDWVVMSSGTSEYVSTFDVSLVSDGIYSINVFAVDIVGNYAQVSVDNIMIDREPPQIAITNPIPRWYSDDFYITAGVTDNLIVDTVMYRWENLPDTGAWQKMVFAGLDYTSILPFDVNSVSSGNYTITVWANDSMNNSGTEYVDIGIDHLKPISNIDEPARESVVMATFFNLTWSGNDYGHSGIDCYQIIYEYCKEGFVPGDVECSGEINLFSSCSDQAPPYEFNAQVETGIEDLDGYGFWFKSKATDNAGNVEDDKTIWDTNISIYIPKLISFTVSDNQTNGLVRNGGKVATNRTIVISLSALEDVLDNLNMKVCHYEHVLGVSPPTNVDEWNCTTCTNTRECNSSIVTYVTEQEDRTEVSYLLYAENASDTDMKEYLPPTAPYNYFYYTVYHHYLCNFLIKDTLTSIIGSSDIIAVEVRNIQSSFDVVGLTLTNELAKFVETNSQYLNVPLSPMEETIIYVRIIPRSKDFSIVIVGNSTLANPTLAPDTDEIEILIGMPADFPSLNWLGLVVFALLAVVIYLKFVRIEN
ncbi:MAG: hypothetical protein KAS04_01855 [Candidatus Aenigmarchaeota archaeon]|nr:hypothetical protein [Candidatus Aenigmarchaeota archaeon]